MDPKLCLGSVLGEKLQFRAGYSVRWQIGLGHVCCQIKRASLQSGCSFYFGRPYINPTSNTTKHYFANGQRLATRTNDELYYLHTDHLGSTSLVTDKYGNVEGRVFYDPLGNLIQSETSLDTGLIDRLFTGQRWESSTNLYDYNARFYDPMIGSFTQPDSIAPNPMDPRAWNRFGYVYGNSVNYTDPSGYNPLAFALIGASLFATGSAVHYSATHPGDSFDQAEYLNTVWRWTKRGGFFGAAFSAGIAGGTVFGAEFGVSASSLFNASTTSGLASILLTCLVQGGYDGNITQIEDIFLSGFYTVFALGAGSAGVSQAG